MNTDELLKLKRIHDRVQRDIDKSEGAKEELLKQLKQEFDCSSLEELEQLSQENQATLKEAERSFAKHKERVEREFKDKPELQKYLE